MGGRYEKFTSSAHHFIGHGTLCRDRRRPHCQSFGNVNRTFGKRYSTIIYGLRCYPTSYGNDADSYGFNGGKSNDHAASKG
jgi:hypothetical protein